MEYPVPRWFDELCNNFKAGAFRQFLLDGNIHDKFIWPNCYNAPSNMRSPDDYKLEPGSLLSLRDFLVESLFHHNDMQVSNVLYYSTTTGLLLYGRNTDGKVCIEFPASSQQPPPSFPLNMPDLLKQALEGATNRVPSDRNQIESRITEALLQIEFLLKRKVKDSEQKTRRIATIIDYFDKAITETSDLFGRHLTERVQRWAMSNPLATSGNVSIIIAENRENLPKPLQTDESGTLPIRIQFPDNQYRKSYYQGIGAKAASNNTKSPLEQFLTSQEDAMSVISQLTRGFKVIDCEKVVRIAEESMYEPQISEFFFQENAANAKDTSKLLHGLLMKEKKDVISANSHGMLQPIESPIRFKDIGGLEGVKTYFHDVSNAIRQRETNERMAEIIPKGVLLAGPPGTGKTLLAKALAHESGVSLVKMGEIRSMWVGESEKNLSMVLKLLKEMAPVIVFVDEIDQAIGSRSTSSGDSGVGGRMFGKILEFMGDNDNRGDVIWIAATNRADLLDDAMIRRFDRIIPVLLPGSVEEWKSVFNGIAHQLGCTFEEGVIDTFVEENVHLLRSNHSGSSVEMVARYAFQKAVRANRGDASKVIVTAADMHDAFQGFKSNFDHRVYLYQTLLAIAACNEISFIPQPSETYSYGKIVDTAISEAIQNKTNAPLDALLEQYANSTRR